MTEQRLDEVLARLEVRLTPPPAFADRLFEQLAVDAGLRRSPARGLAWAVALVALLAAALIGALVLGAGSRQGRLAIRPPETPSPMTSPPSATPVETPMVHIASTILKQGVPAPNWRGHLLDGRAFTTDSLRGRPAAVLVDWCMCLAQNPAPAFLDAARQRRDVALVLVSVESKGTTSGLVESVGAKTPVLLDEGDGLLAAWGLQGFPALVLLRADGTVADIQLATFDANALASILDALVHGKPIPTARILPPFPTDAQGHQLLSSVLTVGAMAPELAARGVDERQHSTRDLLGSKAVVGFWLPPHTDGTPVDDTPPPEALLRAAGEAGIRVLLIAEGEPEPGDAKRYLDGLGSSMPAIVEWDGRLYTTWGLLGPETVVLLDEGGRVAALYGPQGYTQPDAILGSFVAGQPLPSPSLFP